MAVWDDGEAGRAKAKGEGFQVVDLRDADWAGFSSFVLSPGVPLTHPEPHWSVKMAQAAGVEVIGDVELFARERAKLAPGSPFIAITGTNGKSTTTALIAHILREAGRDVQLGGNIGTPILALAPPAQERFHVIECSSFQIDLAPSLAPRVGVLLNLTPDHIDRHGTMEIYAAVKERLVAKSRCAVIGVDDDHCRAIHRRLEDAGVPTLAISNRRGSETGQIYYENMRLNRQISLGSRWCVGENLVDLSQVRTLRGAHNGQNAAAAWAACEWLEIAHDDIARKQAEAQFRANVLTHIKDIADKYIIPGETADSAIMFVPAESVFATLHDQFGDVVEQGFRRRVYIVSPTTLMATLNTVRAV